MGHIIEMRLRTLVLAFLTVMCLNANAQAREPSESSLETVSSIYALPPFERAVCCIKYYEGMHRTYSSNMSLKEADALLRKDLQSLCAMFSKYGKDSLLLAALAYNVGPGKVLGCKGRWPKSTLLKKIEAGIRDFKEEYVQFCHWKGKKIPSIERRRYAELMLLYVK